jgi:putative acetyltransferase
MEITVRRVEPSDYTAMQKIFAGPRVIWGTLQIPYPSIDIWRQRLTETPEGTIRLAACIEGEMVGQLDIHTLNYPRRKHAGQIIGMAVRDDCQGKGVGSALLQAALEMADQWLNLRRLELEVYADNEPAVHLYQKNGFVIEGTLTGYAYRAGQYVDVLTMARFRNPDR